MVKAIFRSAASALSARGAGRFTITCLPESKPVPFIVRPLPALPLLSMNLEAARQQMIEQQVHTWDVFDERVLQAMGEVRRELFVPPQWRGAAFADGPTPLPRGQVMLAPKIQGRILQALDLAPDSVVLEVGTGSGYLAACMGKLAATVRSIEIFPELASQASAALLEAAINNVAVEAGDGMRLEENARYDAIAVTGSLPLYDERFQRALKPGGRLFIVVGPAPVMEAWKITRVGEREWTREGLFETVIDPLINAPRPAEFVF